MGGTLALVGVVLIVGWGVWWWLLRGHQQEVADLAQQIDALEKRHESQ